jgi:hypothetical protein
VVGHETSIIIGSMPKAVSTSSKYGSIDASSDTEDGQSFFFIFVFFVVVVDYSSLASAEPSSGSSASIPMATSPNYDLYICFGRIIQNSWVKKFAHCFQYFYLFLLGICHIFICEYSIPLNCNSISIRS